MLGALSVTMDISGNTRTISAIPIMNCTKFSVCDLALQIGGHAVRDSEAMKDTNMHAHMYASTKICTFDILA